MSGRQAARLGRFEDLYFRFAFAAIGCLGAVILGCAFIGPFYGHWEALIALAIVAPALAVAAAIWVHT